MWIEEKTTGHPDDDVQKIKLPTLIVRGVKDYLISKQSAYELSGKIAESDFANIPFCGREVCVEQPALLMNMMNQFLKK